MSIIHKLNPLMCTCESLALLQCTSPHKDKQVTVAQPMCIIIDAPDRMKALSKSYGFLYFFLSQDIFIENLSSIMVGGIRHPRFQKQEYSG